MSKMLFKWFYYGYYTEVKFNINLIIQHLLNMGQTLVSSIGLDTQTITK